MSAIVKRLIQVLQVKHLYGQFTMVLFSLALILLVLYFGQHIFIPLFLALLFAILLSPVVTFLMRFHCPRTLAALIAVALSTLLMATFVLLVSLQIGAFAGELESIQFNIDTHYRNFQIFIKDHFSISYSVQNEYVDDFKQQSLTTDRILQSGALSSITDVFFNIVLIPLYTFLFLLYKEICKEFLHQLTGRKWQAQLNDILYHIKRSVQRYLIGLITEVAIVSSLTALGFMLVGVQHALLLGVITGIFNLIPYIGILCAGFLSVLASLSGSLQLNVIVGVIAVNSIVQLIDNNIIVPLVVSSKVKVNALATLIGIVLGGTVAGIAGMFMAIPVLAIMKVVFDRVDSLKPWGYVLGDGTVDKLPPDQA